MFWSGTIIVASFRSLFSYQQKVQLSNYKETFQDKVDEVDDKYKERIHLLMTENAELRFVNYQICYLKL